MCARMSWGFSVRLHIPFSGLIQSHPRLSFVPHFVLSSLLPAHNPPSFLFHSPFNWSFPVNQPLFTATVLDGRKGVHEKRSRRYREKNMRMEEKAFDVPDLIMKRRHDMWSVPHVISLPCSILCVASCFHGFPFWSSPSLFVNWLHLKWKL